MKKILFFTGLLTFFLLADSYSQCVPSITYTAGANGAINFTAGTGGGGPYIYFWEFGDNTYDSIANPTHVYSYNANYVAWLSLYDSSSLFFCDSISAPVVVSNAPQNASCPGSANFTVTPNGPQTTFTNSTGSWTILDFGDGSPQQGSFSNSINHQYHLNGSYTVKTVAYGIFAGAYLLCDSATQIINVNNVPCQAAFSFFADTSSYTIYCTSTALGNANASWYLNGVLSGTNVDYYNTSVLTPGTYTICQVVNGPGGCYDSTCQSTTLTYTPSCTGVTFSYAPLATCDTYQFDINNVGAPLSSVEWYVNSTLTSTAMSTPITLDFTSPLNDVIYQTVTAAAHGTICYSSQLFSFINPSTFGIYLDTFLFGNTWFAYPQYGLSVTSELWDFGDGTTSNLAYPSHTYATSGYYTVCHYITLTNGCSYAYCESNYFYKSANSQGISYFVVVGPTGIGDVNMNETSITVFPNPARDFINIAFSPSIPIESDFKLYDVYGKLIASLPLKKDSPSFLLNTATFSDGLYLYEIRSNDSVVKHGKIVLAK